MRLPHAAAFASLLFTFVAACRLHAGDATPAATPPEATVRASPRATIPIREVTVFKDGHAFVLHEGTMPLNADGSVELTDLPSPVIGTFWAYSREPGMRMHSVAASEERVPIRRTALALPELLDANVGRIASIREHGSDVAYRAVILGIPTRTVAELHATESPERRPELVAPVRSDFVKLRTVGGSETTFLPLSRIERITFEDEPATAAVSEELRRTLRLRLAPTEDEAQSFRPEADVGMVYLQKGLRWIPSYRIDLGEDGKARLLLQATLINELADLHDARLHLVIGVPSFAFQDTLDPIALQKTAARLSEYFDPNARTAYAFSNAIMSQVAIPQHVRMTERRQPAAEATDLGPELDGGKEEDLFIHTVQGITLARGGRMTLPVREIELPFESIYTLDLPIAPPPEARQHFNNQQQSELARLFSAPKAMHVIRLTNNATAPLTTAPALILKNGRILAQTMMTYTPRGGTTDLTLTTAVNIRVKHEDSETKRTPNAVQWNGHAYSRIDLTGEIHLANHEGQAIRIEVERNLLGDVDRVGQDGALRKAGWNDTVAWSERPHWWHWYDWPYWWGHFHGVARIRWTIELQPGASETLTYDWHYYWR